MTATGNGDVPPQQPPPVHRPAKPPLPPPPASPGSRPGNRGRWWALGAVVTVSAVCAGLLVASGGSGDGGSGDGGSRDRKGTAAGPRAGDGTVAGLAGYGFTPDLCAVTSFHAFENTGNYRLASATPPVSTGRTQAAADTMGCEFQLLGTRREEGGTETVSVSLTVVLHKETDPRPAFGPSYRAEETLSTETVEISVEEVPDLGDEAYSVARIPAVDGPQDLRVTLGVREGGMTYRMTWSGRSTNRAQAFLDAMTVRAMLRFCAKWTLPRLKTDAG